MHTILPNTLRGTMIDEHGAVNADSFTGRQGHPQREGRTMAPNEEVIGLSNNINMVAWPTNIDEESTPAILIQSSLNSAWSLDMFTKLTRHTWESNLVTTTTYKLLYTSHPAFPEFQYSCIIQYTYKNSGTSNQIKQGQRLHLFTETPAELQILDFKDLPRGRKWH